MRRNIVGWTMSQVSTKHGLAPEHAVYGAYEIPDWWNQNERTGWVRKEA